MTIPSHVLLGAVIGKITGDIPTAVAVSVLVDVDHFISYARHGVLLKPKKFWEAVTDPKDPYGDQRGYLHNVIVAGIISLATLWIGSSFAVTFSAAYFGHLALDAFENLTTGHCTPGKESISKDSLITILGKNFYSNYSSQNYSLFSYFFHNKSPRLWSRDFFLLCND